MFCNFLVVEIFNFARSPYIYIYIYIYGDSKAHAIIPPRFNDSSFFYGSGGDSCSFMELVVRSVKRKHHKSLEFNYDFVHCYIIQ